MRNMTRLNSCASLVRCSLVVFMVALTLVMIGFLRAEAATLVVDDNCSLMNAIVSANFDSSVGGCTAGNGDDTVALANTTYVYTSPVSEISLFPQISSAIVISGNGATIQRDLSLSCLATVIENAFALFVVGPSGTLTLDDVTLQNGCSEAGGAIGSAGRLILNNSRIMSNTAAVGAGVYAPSGVVTVTNSSFISNTALNTGGGMIFNEGKVEKPDFYLNTAQGKFFLFDYDGGGAALVLQGPNAKYLSSNRFTQNYSVRDGAAIYVVGTAHMDNNLSDASDAINRGVSNSPSTDFEGDPRPVDVASDLGYDEFDPTVSIAVSKTVGTEAGSCASTTSLTVDANTAVYYCVTVYNSGEVTFTDHTLTDAQLGVQAILSYNIAPGETVQFTHSLISALGPVTMTESLTNTVFVTSTNVVGPDARAAGAMIVPATASDSAQAVVIVEHDQPAADNRLLLPKLERQ